MLPPLAVGNVGRTCYDVVSATGDTMRPILLLFAFMAIGPASSATLSLHNGSGRDCYIQTLLDVTPEGNSKALSICDRAVVDAETEGTDSYTRAATFVNRADIRLRLEEYGGVVTDSTHAISLFDDLAPAYVNLGAGLIGLKHYKEALTVLDRAIDLGGGDPELAYFDRALAKENLGDIRGAYYDYHKAAELNPKFRRAIDELTRFKVTTPPG
jgi:tetratricopeptide (TPR) repeat protein